VAMAETDAVLAIVGDRLVAVQGTAGLPVSVTPLRPIPRGVAQLRAQQHITPPSPLPRPGGTVNATRICMVQ
jgi:hypothetical protein